MTFFDDNSENSYRETVERGAGTTVSGAPSPPTPDIREDLRVPWSWAHVFLFLLFALGSTFVIPAALATYLMVTRHMTLDGVQRFLLTNAAFAVGGQVLVFAAWMLFLYVTIGLMKETPCWRGIGWRPLTRSAGSPSAAAGLFFLTGIALAVFVGVTGSKVHPKGKIPIEDLFKDRDSTLMLMGLAVLVAPIVEETIFRGFLYPVIARSMGVPAGILITGILFGLLHGLQLGWTWGFVGLLILVGIVFTYARARTGSVFASYLCHLGYNFALFLGTAAATRGFTRFPPPGP